MTGTLRAGLPPLPAHFAALRVDARGYPVPFFVAIVDGVPDFRVIDVDKRARCVAQRLCWLCGQRLGAYGVFVVGPMCAVNRVSSEPPSHRECAEFAVRACPFLIMPKATRREATLPAGHVPPAGVGLKRNPGVALLWVTKEWSRFRVDGQAGAVDGILWRMGDPREVACYAEGRRATADEIRASVESGIPLLTGEIPDDVSWYDRHRGLAQLGRDIAAAWKVLGVTAPITPLVEGP